MHGVGGGAHAWRRCHRNVQRSSAGVGCYVTVQLRQRRALCQRLHEGARQQPACHEVAGRVRVRNGGIVGAKVRIVAGVLRGVEGIRDAVAVGCATSGCKWWRALVGIWPGAVTVMAAPARVSTVLW